MARQYKSYVAYRALLHLYPKAHRQVYGEQMVQTLDDILSDQRGRLGRAGVWLRVALELPANVLEENVHNIGGFSVNKLTKITNKQLLYGVAALLIAGSYLTLGTIWRHQRGQINMLNAQVNTLSNNQVAVNSSYYAPTIIPSEDSVYLPLAKLKLAAARANEQLVYTYEGDHSIKGSKKVFPAQLGISTHDLSVSNYSTTQQFDCTQVVYADFTEPSYPVNPSWKNYGSKKLADGRTMNVYYAPSIPGCASAWQMQDIDSKAIAAALLEADSY